MLIIVGWYLLCSLYSKQNIANLIIEHTYPYSKMYIQYTVTNSICLYCDLPEVLHV